MANEPPDPLSDIPTLIRGKTWEEMTPGLTFRTTGRTITEADVVSFVTLVGVNEPLFFDAQYGIDHGYEGRLAPGMMTFSYAEGLVIQGGSIHGTGLAFLHTDLDIKKPVYVGDTITVVVEVTGQRAASSGNRGLITTKNTVYNQHRDVVMVYSPVRLTKGGDAGG
jgi:acyl dehydratase